MNKQFTKFFNPERISLQLMRVVFSIYLLTTLIITGIQVWAEFQRTQNDISAELNTLADTFYKPVATSIWQFNDTQLDVLTQGMIQMAAIEGIDITTANNEKLIKLRTFEENDTPFNLFFITKKLTWKLKGQEIDLGTMRLYSSSDIILNRLLFGFTLIFISAFIKVAILWALLLWAFKRFLHRPIKSLISQIDGINLDKIGQHRIDLQIPNANELTLLQDHVNHLFDTIAADKNALIEAEGNRRIWLENEVAARTQELTELNEKLAHLAATDALTGIKNHRIFFEQAQILFDLSVRQKQNLSLLVLDIDFFKKINDNFGHSAGDEVLRDFAHRVEKRLRRSDIFARVGGEEFAILLPDTPRNAAQNIAEEIRQCVERRPVIYKDQEIHLTVSIGLCERADQDKNINQLFNRSDALLYKAKHNGRNRVEVSK